MMPLAGYEIVRDCLKPETVSVLRCSRRWGKL